MPCCQLVRNCYFPVACLSARVIGAKLQASRLLCTLMVSCNSTTCRGMLGVQFSDLVHGEMQWVLVSAYMIELHALLDALPDLRAAFRIVIAHGWRTDRDDSHNTGSVHNLHAAVSARHGCAMCATCFHDAQRHMLCICAGLGR